MKATAILDHLSNVKQTGTSQWLARCPAHEDRHPSLSIGTGEDGRILLKCHADCTTSDILAAMNLTERDLFTESKLQSGNRIEATYDYQDAQGNLLYQVIRYADKKFKQQRPGANGRWINQVKGLPRVLYRLPQVLSANPNDWIFVVEGEKDVDNLFKQGLIATTNSGGAGKWSHLSDDSALYNRRVVIIPDKDQAGYQHANDVCQRLNGEAKELRYLVLDGSGKDVTNWFNAGGTQAKLLQLAKNAPAWTPQINVQLSWPDPQPLDTVLPAVLPFDANLLPATLCRWITDIAERMQCPPDFPAVTAMIALSGIAGRKIRIRPKRFDDWMVVPNLWGALIGRPSIMKTPPLKATLKPLDRLIDVASANYSERLKQYHHDKEIAKLRRNVLETQIKAAIRAGKNYDKLSFELAIVDAIQPPVQQRYVVNDSTVQALGQILADNPNGIIVVRDELMGLLKFLESVGQESSRAFFLEGWDGDGCHEVDRIGRGHLKIKGLCLSVMGTIQPGPLQEYLRGAVEGGVGDDGFMQRFQLAVWPDDPAEWINVDRIPDYQASQTAFEVFEHVNTLTAETTGAILEENCQAPFLHFTDAAQDRFDQWMYTRENRLRQGQEDGAMESHLTKYRSLIPSLALLIHLAEFKTGPVDDEVLDRAIGWEDYLNSHARRIYASAQTTASQPEHLLAAKIQHGHLADGFTLRDVYGHHWSGLNDKEQVKTALLQLVDYSWLRPEKVATGGRPTTQYRINPKLFK